jgi:hypothetical protein
VPFDHAQIITWFFVDFARLTGLEGQVSKLVDSLRTSSPGSPSLCDMAPPVQVRTKMKQFIFFSRASKNPLSGICLRGLVDDVRTGFESRNDATIYIPNFKSLELS